MRVNYGKKSFGTAQSTLRKWMFVIAHLQSHGCLSLRFYLFFLWLCQSVDIHYLCPYFLLKWASIQPSPCHNQLIVNVLASAFRFTSYCVCTLFQSHPLIHSSVLTDPKWLLPIHGFIPLQVPERTGSAGGASGAGGEGDDHSDHLPRGGLPGSVM